MTIEDIKGIFAEYEPNLLGVRREYSVLIPLVELGGELHVLFEVRADHLKWAPGETCFPGGRMEQGETPLECALRETWEEIGIPASAIRPIARLDSVYHQSSFLLHPILAQVDSDAVADMKPCADEVKRTELVPLSHFLTNEPDLYSCEIKPDVSADFPYDEIGAPEGYRWRTGKLDIPIWKYSETPIWGLTARILLQMLHKLGHSWQ